MQWPPFHLILPKEHVVLLLPGDDGELEPHVPSMQALQHVREMEWRSLASRATASTPLASACESVPTGAVRHAAPHRNLLRARDGRLSTMQVMRRWSQKVTRVVIPARPCIFCGGPEEDIGHMRLLCARDKEVAGLLCRRVEEFTAEFFPDRQNGGVLGVERAWLQVDGIPDGGCCPWGYEAAIRGGTGGVIPGPCESQALCGGHDPG